MRKKIISRFVSAVAGGILLLLLGLHLNNVDFVNAAAYIKFDGVDGESLDKCGDCEDILVEIATLEDEKEKLQRERDALQLQLDDGTLRPDSTVPVELVPLELDSTRDPGATIDTGDTGDTAGDSSTGQRTVQTEILSMDLSIAELDQDIRDWKQDYTTCQGEWCDGEDETHTEFPLRAIDVCEDCDALWDEILAHRQLLHQPTNTGLRMNKAELVEAIAHKTMHYARHCLIGDDERREHKNICLLHEEPVDMPKVCRMCDREAELDLEAIAAELENMDKEDQRERLEALLREIREENASCWVRCAQHFASTRGGVDDDCDGIARYLEELKQRKLDIAVNGSTDEERRHVEYLIITMEKVMVTSCAAGDGPDIFGDPDVDAAKPGGGMTGQSRRRGGAVVEDVTLAMCREYASDHKDWIIIESMSSPLYRDADHKDWIIIESMSSPIFRGTSDAKKEIAEAREAHAKSRMIFAQCQKLWRDYVVSDCPDCDLVGEQIKKYEDWVKAVYNGLRDREPCVNRTKGETTLGDVVVVRELDKSSTKLQECADGGNDNWDFEGGDVLRMATMRHVENELQNLRERFRKCLRAREEQKEACEARRPTTCPSCDVHRNEVDRLELLVHELAHAVQTGARNMMDNALVAAIPALEGSVAATGSFDTEMVALSLNYEKVVFTYEKLDNARKSLNKCKNTLRKLSDDGFCLLDADSLREAFDPYCFDCEALAHHSKKGNIEYNWKVEKGAKIMEDVEVRVNRWESKLAEDTDETIEIQPGYSEDYYSAGGGTSHHDTAMAIIRKIGAADTDDDGTSMYESCLEYQARLMEEGYCEEEDGEHEELSRDCPSCHVIAKELEELRDRAFYLIDRSRFSDYRTLAKRIVYLQYELRRCIDKSTPLIAQGLCQDEDPTDRPTPQDIEPEDSGDFQVDSFFDVFFDIEVEDSNADAIAYLKRNNIVKGNPDGSFKPLNGINRAELAKIVVLAVLGVDPDPSVYRACFPDVTDEWFARYVCYALEQGWVNGYPDGLFRPANPSNKVEALKIIFEVLGLGSQLSETPGDSLFRDVDPNAWYYRYLYFAMRNGLIDDIDDEFDPTAEMTRGGMSEVMYRVMLLMQTGDLDFD